MTSGLTEPTVEEAGLGWNENVGHETCFGIEIAPDRPRSLMLNELSSWTQIGGVTRDQGSGARSSIDREAQLRVAWSCSFPWQRTWRIACTERLAPSAATAPGWF